MIKKFKEYMKRYGIKIGKTHIKQVNENYL